MMQQTRFGRVVFIPGQNNGRYPFCNSLFVDDKVKAIIDPASDEKVLRNLKEYPGVDAIIHSHFHEDHLTFAYLFQDSELWVPEKEAQAFSSEDVFLDWYGMSGEFKEEWRKVLRTQFNFRERNPDRVFRHGDILEFGETRAEVVHTPGHTWGHSSFFFPGEELMFLADIDLTKFGPWYGDRVSDIDDLIASVERVKRYPAKIYITGHEQGIIEGSIDELCKRYLAVIDEREDKLRYLLKESPRTMDEIVDARIVYKTPREPKEFFDFGEYATMKKHLERMMKKGEAVEEGGKYRIVK
jgi:hydroxyacylglutathione hydrolase